MPTMLMNPFALFVSSVVFGRWLEIELEPNEAGKCVALLLAKLVENSSISCSPDARRRMETGGGQKFLFRIDRTIEIVEEDWQNFFDEGVSDMRIVG